MKTTTRLLLLLNEQAIFTFQTTSVNPATFDPSLTKVGTSEDFTWILGDGSFSVGDSVSKVYANAGVKEIQLFPQELYQFVRSLDFNTDDAIGHIPQLKNFPALATFSCFSNSLIGSIPSLTANPALSTFSCSINSLIGSIPSLTANTALVNFSCFSNSLIGIVPSLAANPVLVNFRCHTNSLTGMTDVECFAIADLQIQNNGMDQANVDAVFDSIYANRNSYTDPTPALNIGGTNATPSGIWQYAAVPSTAKEKGYALVNDDDAEGFNTWTITITFGVSAYSSGYSLGYA